MKISACLICRDEERWLPDALASIRGAVDEIVVVDTGSEDRSIEIAESFGAVVDIDPWREDFSRARNRSIDCASGDWCLWIDADERLQDGVDLREIVRDATADVLYVEIANDLPSGGIATFRAPRLFRRDPSIRFEGAVHNQLVHPGPAAHVDVRIRHLGYAAGPEVLARKFARSVPLLEAQIERDPQNAFARFNLAVFLLRAGRAADAHMQSSRASALLAESDPGSPLHVSSLDLQGLSLLALGRAGDAVRTLESALALDDGATDAAFDLALARERTGDLAGAVVATTAYFRARAIERQRPPTTNAMNRSLGSVEIAWNNRGLFELRRKRFASARAAFAASAAANPTWAVPLVNWADSEVTRGALASAETIYERAIALDPDDPTAHAKRGVVALRRGDLETAQRAFEELVARRPEDAAAAKQLEVIREKLHPVG